MGMRTVTTGNEQYHAAECDNCGQAVTFDGQSFTLEDAVKPSDLYMGMLG